MRARSVACLVAIVTGTLPLHGAGAPGAALDRTPGAAYYRALGTVSEPGRPYADFRIDVDAGGVSAGGSCRTTVTIRKPDGSRFGVMVESERALMTSRTGPGAISRYMLQTPAGEVFDYRIEGGAEPHLPLLLREAGLLPCPEDDTRFAGGFATTGALLGHGFVREPLPGGLAAAAFDEPQEIRLRPDMIIATSRFFRDDGTPPASPDRNWNFRDFTRDELRVLIDAGMNYFRPDDATRAWMAAQPVFFAGPAAWPEDLYRANYVPGTMFLDEPMVHLGWEAKLGRKPRGPEEVAVSLRSRIENALVGDRCRLQFAGPADPGSAPIRLPAPPAWETEYWAAFHEVAAGAGGVVHEGRYRERGYGWDPEDLFGDDLSGLATDEMFDVIFGFLRGPARVFGVDWGMSIYGQSDPELRVPALRRAYDMGARHFWYWTSDHDHHVPYEEQVRLSRALTSYAREHPRGSPPGKNRQASLGIVVPAGHAVSWPGVWGMAREATNECGVSYGTIAAAAYWEGIIASRAGVGFDMLVEHPRVDAAGYERLVFIHRDATVSAVPPLDRARDARFVRADLVPVEFDPAPSPGVAVRFAAADGLTADGDLSDWPADAWVILDRETHRFPDNVEIECRIALPAEDPSFPALGMRVVDLTPALRARYLLEPDLREGMALLASVEPGSPAAKAGLREGDVVVGLGGGSVRWPFQVNQRIDRAIAAGKTGTDLVVRRNGLDRTEDVPLAARWQAGVDDTCLWFAAEVADGTHHQPGSGWDYWQGDSVQVGLDPLLERRPDGYGEEGHEIGLVLQNGTATVWRWKGRRGQPLGAVRAAQAVIRRTDVTTSYEARVPLVELAPFAPRLRSVVGVDVVVNDSDGGPDRDARLEWAPGAMTYGKRPARFLPVEFAAPRAPGDLRASLRWITRSAPEGGNWRLRLEAAGERPGPARVTVRVRSADTPDAPALEAVAEADTGPTPRAWEVRVPCDAPPGRYRLEARVLRQDGRVAAVAGQPVYCYPRTRAAAEAGGDG